MQPDTAPPAAEWHVASILVHLRPERREAVRAAVAVLPGTEIHAEEGGKMVVTVEGPHEGWIADRMTALHLLDGVLSAVLVFHHVEPNGDGTVQRA
ncbi:chaperone NapD [Azospirillum sp. sgz302134]